MKFNEKLLAHMRAATRSLTGHGGAKAATAAIQDALKILSPRKEPAQPAMPQGPSMRDINPPPQHAQARVQVPEPESAPASEPESAPTSPLVRDPAEVLKDLVPELMAKLDRAGVGGLNGFKMPSFELPGGMPGLVDPAPNLPGQFVDGSFTNAAGTRSY